MTFFEVENHVLNQLTNIHKDIEHRKQNGLTDRQNHALASHYVLYMDGKLDDWFMKHFNTDWTNEYGFTNEEFHDLIEQSFYVTDKGVAHFAKGYSYIPTPFHTASGQYVNPEDRLLTVDDVDSFVTRFVKQTKGTLNKLAQKE